MKKAISTVLLAAMLVCILLFALSACNSPAELKGAWIGYDVNDSLKQIYLSADKDGTVEITELCAVDFSGEINESKRIGKAQRWQFNDFKLTDAYEKSITLHLSKSGGVIKYRYNDDSYVLLKRTMSLSEWRDKAFALEPSDSDLPSFPVYKPLYFADRDRRLEWSLERRGNLESCIGKICLGYYVKSSDLSDFDQTVEHMKKFGFIFLTLQKSENSSDIFDVSATRAVISDEEPYVVASSQTAQSAVYYDGAKKKFFTKENLKFGSGDDEISLCGEFDVHFLGFYIRTENTEGRGYEFSCTKLSEQNVNDFVDGTISVEEFFDILWHRSKT